LDPAEEEVGAVRLSDAEPEGERYPIFDPTGVHKPEEQVLRVDEPDRAKEVEG
jgi:hypothetical protein